MRNTSLVALLLGLLAVAPVALAQETGTRPLPPQWMEAQKERTMQIRENALQTRDALKAQVEGRRALIEANVEERKAIMETFVTERRATLEERRAELKNLIEERKASFKDRLGDRVSDRYDHVMRLLEAMVARLSGIADRIDARIDTLAADGVDVSDAEAELSEARALIDTAEDKVAALSEAVADALASDNPREALQAVKPKASEAKQALRAAHEALREAAQALPRTPRVQDES